MERGEYQFLKTAGRIFNAGQAKTLIFSGNIHDLFRLHTDGGVNYVPLTHFLTRQWHVSGRILLVYELNGPIRFLENEDQEKVRDAWLQWRTGFDADRLAVENMLSSGRTQAQLETMRKNFDVRLQSAIGNPTVALEFLRQLCLCSRTRLGEKSLLHEDLIILIEAADMLIPEGEIRHLSDADRHRISICQDWFSDPSFVTGGDAVVLISESRSQINHRVARLPQIIEVRVSSPDKWAREAFIKWFSDKQTEGNKPRFWSSLEELVKFTAGLSIHALMQLLKGACHENRHLTLSDVIDKVQDYIQSQVGDEIVAFKKPAHTLDDVVGFRKLKAFLRKELIPRFRSSGPEALPGAAVCGPIGGGKTFIFEALAHELDMVVLILKNIRSKWFGETDVIFERLRRVLDALSKVLIFVDEADTQFGGVGSETHSTERRLTGKIQAMMSDPLLRGRVIWLLMTARIHMLSPDIRRPGRVGDLIIPILDPEGPDLEDFIRWAIEPVLKEEPSEEDMKTLAHVIGSPSAASLASLRGELKAKAWTSSEALSIKEIIAIIGDHLSPAINQVRRYQTLQALVNCTRRSLLPNPGITEEERLAWEKEIRSLEAQGVR